MMLFLGETENLADKRSMKCCGAVYGVAPKPPLTPLFPDPTFSGNFFTVVRVFNGLVSRDFCFNETREPSRLLACTYDRPRRRTQLLLLIVFAVGDE